MPLNGVREEKEGCRVGIDVGGTFTDLVLADAATGALTFFKEPSVPDDPSDAVERGLQGIIARAGVSPDAIDLVVHGTTLGLNTIIQRKGATLALVVSRGNRDVLEIGRSRMPDSYDFRSQKEEPLVPRDMVFEIDARMTADGAIETHPAQADIEALAQTLVDRKVDAVAVMLLNAYVDDTLEREVAAALRDALPGVLVTESAALWPEIREFERALVATLNAYIHPQVDDYLARLRERMDAIDVKAPLYITASNGGTLGVESARNRPIDTILSGPATGVVAAARLAALGEQRKILTVDMGGTSCDMAVSLDGEPEYTTRTTIGDFPLILPVVNVSAIGAGGGSIVWVDNQGVLKVGPQSAGAAPGPVCYGRGGTEPTMTDCYLAAGYLRTDRFLGGRMTLDKDAANQALAGISDRIGLPGDDKAAQAAEAVLRVSTAKMATELYKAFAQKGLDPREFTLIAYGGAGPTQGTMLAEEVGLRTVLIVPSPGTLCALGAVMTDIKRDYVRVVRRQIDSDQLILPVIAAALDGMETEAREWIAGEGTLQGEVTLSWSADMRYAGQAYELSVDIPAELRGAMDEAVLIERFHQVHESVYGFRDTEARVELTSLRARIVGAVPPIEITPAAGGTPPDHDRRRVYYRGEWLETAVYARDALRPGDWLDGPALVEQEDTTTWIVPGWRGTVDTIGNIRIEKG